MLKINHLSKSYKKKIVLDDVFKIADKALVLINGKMMELPWKKGDTDLEDKYLCLLEET